jgi:hypothetical protein
LASRIAAEGIPNEITEPKNQDTYTSELHHIGEVRVEGFNELREHRRQR